MTRILLRIISRSTLTKLVRLSSTFSLLPVSIILSLALSGDSPTQRLSTYLPTLPETHSIAVFVGAMARGYLLLSQLLIAVTLTFTCRKDDFADSVVDEKISISDYSLSASVNSIELDSSDLLIPSSQVACGKVKKTLYFFTVLSSDCSS